MMRRCEGATHEASTQPLIAMMLTLFGAVAVTVMMVAYALEPRSAGWLLVFAGACAASSAYGWLAGTWPFGVVEGVWALVALRRWWTARGHA